MTNKDLAEVIRELMDDLTKLNDLLEDVNVRSLLELLTTITSTTEILTRFEHKVDSQSVCVQDLKNQIEALEKILEQTNLTVDKFKDIIKNEESVEALQKVFEKVIEDERTIKSIEYAAERVYERNKIQINKYIWEVLEEKLKTAVGTKVIGLIVGGTGGMTLLISLFMKYVLPYLAGGK